MVLTLLRIRRLIVHGADSKFESSFTCGVAQLFCRENNAFSCEKLHVTQTKKLISQPCLGTCCELIFLRLFGCDGTKLLGNRPGHRGLLRARVEGCNCFDQRDPCLFRGGSVMSYPTRHDKELARPYGDVSAVRHSPANAQHTAQDEEHLVLVLMAVPGKLPLNLRHFDVLVVDLPDNSR